jgi:hypothetical protein
MKTKTRFPHRRKQDGSEDTMCLACFKTISSDEFEGGRISANVAEQDHVCEFAFPERRANDITFEDGPKRRRSDMDWKMLISREAFLPGE